MRRVCFFTISVLALMTGMGAADAQDDLREKILSMHDRWDQDSLISIGDVYYYRICQQWMTCFDVRLESTGQSNLGHHFRVVAQDRLGYYVADAGQNTRIGTVSGNVAEDTSNIEYMWGEPETPEPSPSGPIEKRQSPVPECVECQEPSDVFSIIMDGKMSLLSTPGFYDSYNMQVLNSGLASLMDRVIPTSTKSPSIEYVSKDSGNIMYYIPNLERGDMYVYMICPHDSQCREFSLVFTGIDRRGLHFEVSVYDREWYTPSTEPSSESYPVVTEYWNHGAGKPRQETGYPESISGNSEFEIIVDGMWRLGKSPEYNHNLYIKSIEDTLFFVGGKARIGDGTLLVYEPVLEVGEQWSNSESYRVLVTGIETDYFYGDVSFMEKMYSGKYITTEPAVEFVISPRLPIPVSSTYVADRDVMRVDQLNDSKYWFRMLEHITLHEPEPTVYHAVPEEKIPEQDDHNAEGDGILDVLTSEISDIFTTILGEDDISDDAWIADRYTSVYSIGGSIMFDVFDAEDGTEEATIMTISRGMIPSNEWPPAVGMIVDGVKAPYTDMSTDDHFVAMVELPLHYHVVEVIPEGVTYYCSGIARCMDSVIQRTVDGDTIITDDGTRIRFSLASAPELGDEGGHEARELISAVCPPGSHIVVDEDDGQTGGSYGRIIGKIYCNGVVLNEYLLDNSPLSGITERFCAGSEFAYDAWAVRHGC